MEEGEEKTKQQKQLFLGGCARNMQIFLEDDQYVYQVICCYRRL
jgi:hypothetical protein